MSETFSSFQELFVILPRPPAATASLFTTDLGDGRIAVCVFSHREHAMLFAMNAQGLDVSGVAPITGEKLREALATEKRNGATHVLLDPSAGSGFADAIAIEAFLARIAV